MIEISTEDREAFLKENDRDRLNAMAINFGLMLPGKSVSKIKVTPEIEKAFLEETDRNKLNTMAVRLDLLLPETTFEGFCHTYARDLTGGESRCYWIIYTDGPIKFEEIYKKMYNRPIPATANVSISKLVCSIRKKSNDQSIIKCSKGYYSFTLGENDIPKKP